MGTQRNYKNRPLSDDEIFSILADASDVDLSDEDDDYEITVNQRVSIPFFLLVREMPF